MPTHLSPSATILTEPAIRDLEAQLRGEVVRPGDAAYDTARQVWNASVDRSPALIVRPLDANDVSAAVQFARAHSLPLAVRAGGHSIAGHGTVDRGLLLDLSRLNGCAIDPERRVATVGGGLTWDELNAAAHDHGLATPGPDVAAVGVAGATLGGGFGWLSRQYGMTIDNLIAAEVVTADGQVLTASGDEHPDLFWALRGGGGNFGIATSLQLRLHPVDTVTGGVLVYPATRAVLMAYLDVAAAAPDALSTITSLMTAPPLPFIPAEAHGTPVFMIIACATGDPGASQQAYAPFRHLGGQPPLADTIAPIPYPALFDLTAMGAARHSQAIRAGLIRDIDEATIDAILDAVANPSSPSSWVMLRVLGGAIARVPAEATAFSHRDQPIYVALNNPWDADQEPDPARHVAWTEGLWRAVSPRVTGAYANFLGDEGPERVRAAFSPAAYDRLASIKRRYDPGNLFRLNANIPPAAPAERASRVA